MGNRAKTTGEVATEGESPRAVTRTEVRTEKGFTAIAKRDAFLPDGTFVGKGSKVAITAEYAARLRAEGDKRFTINA